MREAIHTIAVTVEWMVVAVQLVREDVDEKPMGVDERGLVVEREVGCGPREVGCRHCNKSL
jgi:hypothetical protein